MRLEQANPLLTRGVHGSDNADLSSIAESHDEIYSEDDGGSVYGVTAVNGGRQQQNGGSASMPDLLDEELYEESGPSNGSTLSRVHKVRMQSK